MSTPLKQHLIDPEICIRCYTCEATCAIDAITHDDNNVVVDADKCNYCMDCIPVCPTGSIDEWRVVNEAYTLEQQFDWQELPEQEAFSASAAEDETTIEALDANIAQLLAEAHGGAGGRVQAPRSASKPSINLYTQNKPAVATVQGNYRLTAEQADGDVRHLILNMGQLAFPVLEGQSIGIVPPGTDANGQAHLPRLYSVSSPRDGERANFNNLSLTVKHEPQGLCSSYICKLSKGDKVNVVGPFGATFLLPNDSCAKLLMICTGTGSAPFRAFTMRRQRIAASDGAAMTLVFGARSADALPYFGPLNKIPESILKKHLVFSRDNQQKKRYVQDALLELGDDITELLTDPECYLYICGLRAMELGVEQAFTTLAETQGISWQSLKETMRTEGRYHSETY